MSWKVRSVRTWVSTRILMVPPSFPSENPSWNPLSWRHSRCFADESCQCLYSSPGMLNLFLVVTNCTETEQNTWGRWTPHLFSCQHLFSFSPQFCWSFGVSSKKRGDIRELDPTRNQFPPSFSIEISLENWLPGQSEQHHLGTRAAGDQDLGAWDLIETHGFSMGKSWENARNARRVPWVWWLGESSNSRMELDGKN